MVHFFSRIKIFFNKVECKSIVFFYFQIKQKIWLIFLFFRPNFFKKVKHKSNVLILKKAEIMFFFFFGSNFF